MKSQVKKIFSISILVISICIMGCTSPKEQNLKIICKMINRTHKQIINVYENSNISWEIKEQRILNLILKSTKYVEEWPLAYQDAILLVSPDKLEDYQLKYDEAVIRLSDLIESITNK